MKKVRLFGAAFLILFASVMFLTACSDSDDITFQGVVFAFMNEGYIPTPDEQTDEFMTGMNALNFMALERGQESDDVVIIYEFADRESLETVLSMMVMLENTMGDEYTMRHADRGLILMMTNIDNLEAVDIFNAIE